MPYLDLARMDALDEDEFQRTPPYPWINQEGLLTEEGYRALLETLPEAQRFDRHFGIKRSHGQASHDRFVLEYRAGLELPTPWSEFIEELRGDRYRAFLGRMYGHGFHSLTLHWHYTPSGCSVSPHCDAKHKVGAHIFYFNTEQDWCENWGGQTAILATDRPIPAGSAPSFEDFDQIIETQSVGNRSLLFQRRGTAWHGVREIHCDEGQYRKVFVVAVNGQAPGLGRRLMDVVRGKPRFEY